MKKAIYLLLVLLFSLSLTACGVEIEDTNGADDYSLNTITEENIISMDLGASTYSQSYDGDEEAEPLEYMTKFKGKEFSGVAELYSMTYIGKSDVTIEMGTIQVDQGNFRLMVLLDDEIIHDFDLEEMGQELELKDIKGNLSIRMAGETATFRFFMQVW